MPFPNGENSFVDLNESVNNSFREDVDNLNTNLSSKKGLKIDHLNINGLKNKLDQLRLIFFESKLESFFLNETKIDETVRDVDIVMPGYIIFRRDRNKHGGGVLIYIASEINSAKVRNVNILGFLEIIWIRISLPSTKPIYVCSICRQHSWERSKHC
jgi:hypothetical protein